MAIIGFIVLGDRTSHGGIVISGDTTFTIDGQPVARVGDKVFCPRCDMLTSIVTSRFPTVIDLGQEMAYDQDITSCGALLYSRHNNHAGWGDGGTASTVAAPAASAYRNDGPPGFSEHFVLHDERGNVASRVRYAITTAEGLSVEGTTDAQGRTDVVWTAASDGVAVTVLPEQAAAGDPYHFEEPASGEY